MRKTKEYDKQDARRRAVGRQMHVHASKLQTSKNGLKNNNCNYQIAYILSYRLQRAYYQTVNPLQKKQKSEKNLNTKNVFFCKTSRNVLPPSRPSRSTWQVCAEVQKAEGIRHVFICN